MTNWKAALESFDSSAASLVPENVKIFSLKSYNPIFDISIIKQSHVRLNYKKGEKTGKATGEPEQRTATNGWLTYTIDVRSNGSPWRV